MSAPTTVTGPADWISVVNPRLFLDQLTAMVELTAARSVLLEIISLADQAPGLPDEQLRSRLLALADRAGTGERVPMSTTAAAPLIPDVPGGLPVTARVTGDALTVLHTVVADWPT